MIRPVSVDLKIHPRLLSSCSEVASSAVSVHVARVSVNNDGGVPVEQGTCFIQLRYINAEIECNNAVELHITVLLHQHPSVS